MCEAKSEHGISLRTADYDCSTIFNLGFIDGILATAKPLDREVAEMIHLGVIVEDIASDTGPQIAKGKVTLLKFLFIFNHSQLLASLTLEIEDVNDNNPKFRKSYYRYAVTENSKNGVVIGSVVADDIDKNRTVTYTLEGQSELIQLVHLDSNAGDLVVANKIDHEIYEWLNLTVSNLNI